MSRRDGAIVAWHEVPGTTPPPNEPSRRVRYDSRGWARWAVAEAVQLIKAGRTFRREIPLGLAAPDHTVTYGTVVSTAAFPGTSCQATIAPSRDIFATGCSS